MKVRCRLCKSINVRSSRMRVGDLKNLIHLVMPVRCHHCGHRDYLDIRAVYQIRRAEAARKQAHQHRRAAAMSNDLPETLSGLDVLYREVAPDCSLSAPDSSFR